MYNKLIFRAYAIKNLNEAAAKFKEQTGREAQVFMIRPGWDVFGSKENMTKILVSRFGGFASISVPLYASREEIEAQEIPQKKYVSIQKVKRFEEDEQLQNRLLAYTRYCNYCGRIYGTDPMNVIIHCEAPRCIEKHEEWLDHKAELKRLSGSSQKKIKSDSKQENEEQTKSIIDSSNGDLPDINLDDPDNPTLRGYIYLIEAENGLYKIGRSDNISQRFGELANQSPVPLWLNHAFFVTDYKRAELWLHNQFQNRRHHGEWFQLSEDEVEWIKKLEDYSLDQV